MSDATTLNVTLIDDAGDEHGGLTLTIVSGDIEHPGWTGTVPHGPRGWTTSQAPNPEGPQPPDVTLRIEDGDLECHIAQVHVESVENDVALVRGVSAFLAPTNGFESL